MRDEGRNEAVAAHLRALDAELERIRKLSDAIDRRQQENDAELRGYRRLVGEGLEPDEPDRG